MQSGQVWVSLSAEQEEGLGSGVYPASNNIIREAKMRIVVLAAAFAAMTGDAAAQGAWCTEDMNARNCGFFTLAQCQAAASGNGAYCFANQSVARTGVTEPRKPAKPAKQSR